MNQRFSLDSSRRSVARQHSATCISLMQTSRCSPISALLRIPGPVGCWKTEQGRSCNSKSFLVVSPDCHTLFGYVFYDDMNKKPVAQSQNQHYLLGFRTVYGLLSLLRIAIVVNCFTLVTKI
jgi:hypothetical protein